MKQIVVTAVTASVMFAGAASAADMPVKAVAPAVPYNGWYFSADGSYQSINLPTYSMGARINAPGGFILDSGPAQRFDPRVTGFGTSAALGYVFRDGTFDSRFGSNVRIELGASYVDASGSNSASFIPGTDNRIWFADLAGRYANLGNLNCTPPIACTFAGSLATDYRTWQVRSRLASDYRFGAITLTPSAQVFGGEGRISQAFSQSEVQSGGGPITTLTYNALTKVSWTDWGAKFGLMGRYDAAGGLFADLAGTVGVADRRASLTGADSWTSNFGAPLFNSPSTVIVSGASTAALLANVEAGVGFRPTPLITLRAFAGLNYDDKVPGIANGIYTSSSGGQPATPTHIGFFSETSWYAGAGGSIRF